MLKTVFLDAHYFSIVFLPLFWTAGTKQREEQGRESHPTYIYAPFVKIFYLIPEPLRELLGESIYTFVYIYLYQCFLPINLPIYKIKSIVLVERKLMYVIEKIQLDIYSLLEPPGTL